MKLSDYKFSTQKIKRRYRLIFVSENTFNELWSIKLSRVKVVISSIIIIAAIAFLVSAFIVMTPIKTLLPGYLKSDVRNDNIQAALRLDSLDREVAIKDKYLNNLRNILTDNITIDTTIDKHLSTPIVSIDSFQQASQREKDFLKQFDESEKYNLSILTPLAAEGILFSSPLTGVILPNPKDYNYSDGIKIRVARNSPIASIYDGVVVALNHSIENGTSIIIQHPNGFISTYSNLSISFIEKGNKIIAGQRIAMANEDGKSSNSIVKLELWHEGLPVNPQEYISF
ncbi:MAG: M23 family metallopeptidase [Muribaculaceae bacterium]